MRIYFIKSELMGYILQHILFKISYNKTCIKLFFLEILSSVTMLILKSLSLYHFVK